MESPISAFRFPLPAFPDSTRWHLFRFQLSTSRLPLSALILQVSSFKLQVSGLKFQVSGLKFQVSAFLFLLCLAPLHAANQTWTGTTSNNWTTVTNWNGGAYPGNATTTTNADIALFNTNPGNKAPVFDVAGINLAGFTFDVGAGAFTLGTIGGNAVLLSSGGSTQVTSGDTAAQIINAPIVIENAAAAGSGAYSFLNNSTTTGATLTLGGTIKGMATAGNTTALTFGGLSIGANTVSGIISDGIGGGVVSLTKTGSGTWVLSGTNTYTGATVANGGVVFYPMPGATSNAIPSVIGTLQITGNLTGTGSVLIANGGTLIDGSSTAASNNGITNRINPAATLTMGGANGGGTFTMAAPAASNTHSQTLAALSIGAGGNIINANAATGTTNLTFGGAAGSVYSRSTGGTVTFATGTAGFNVSFTNAPTGSSVSGTSAPILIGAALGGTTIAGGTDFVAAASGTVAAPTYTASGPTSLTADANINLTAANTTLAGGTTASINSLRLPDSTKRTLALGTGSTLTIASGGILAPSTMTTDNINHTISGGNLTSGTGDLWIYAASGTSNTRSGTTNGNPRNAIYAMTIASAIVDNGVTPVSLTVGGSSYSQVLISGTNTYTGGTYLSNGMLAINSDANLGASTGNVTVTSGANYLRLNSAITTSRNFVINSGAMLNIGNANLTLNGALTGGGDLLIGFYAGATGLILNNAENGFTGTYTVTSFLRANEGVGLSSNANLDLTGSGSNSGGVLETSANVTRSLGTGPGQVQFTGGANNFGGGFSAVGGPVTVSLGGIGTPTALTFGSGAFYVGATGAGLQQGLVLQDTNATNTLTWANAIDTNGKTFFVNQAAPTSGNSTAATMTGVLSGTGNLTKAGAGQLILAGNNTYTGTTTVTSGTLLISGSSTGGGAYAVNSGGTLGGTGTIGLASNQNVVVSAGGKVQASSFDRLDLALSGTGTLDVSGALGSGTGSMIFTLDAPTSTVVAIAGTLNIGSNVLNFDDFTFSTTGNFAAGAYKLFGGASSLTGTLGSSLIGTVGGLNSTISIVNNEVILTAVPEPATWALLAFSLTTVVVLRRRRNS